jgi:hypothetical protein
MATEITFYRGDSYPKVMAITDSITKLAVDITGYTFTMTIDTLKNPPDDTTKVFVVDGAITDAAGGLVSFTPTSVDNDQDPKSYYYDVQMVSGAVVRTIVKDKYIITQDITKV